MLQAPHLFKVNQKSGPPRRVKFHDDEIVGVDLLEDVAGRELIHFAKLVGVLLFLFVAMRVAVPMRVVVSVVSMLIVAPFIRVFVLIVEMRVLQTVVLVSWVSPHPNGAAEKKKENQRLHYFLSFQLEAQGINLNCSVCVRGGDGAGLWTSKAVHKRVS